VTQIDFYILGDKAKGDRFLLACRLADKAYQAGHRVCITTDSLHEAEHMNELLWTFNDRSFIPHEICDERAQTANSAAPVMIASQLDKTDEHEVLINLSAEVPACFSQFERLLEPVDQQDNNKVSGRNRYRYYRDCGYSINNHEISS
jgi:DNA polymerase-3 subunit chi